MTHPDTADFLAARAAEIITLRDYFAAAAMQGLFANMGANIGPAATEIAPLCYAYADAMLIARAK
jgi:hypothetical protein